MAKMGISLKAHYSTNIWSIMILKQHVLHNIIGLLSANFQLHWINSVVKGVAHFVSVLQSV